MIGLGSNRLSVCRRGGMSVTQAGKGGMEWLAGGRLPSWAQWWLPYSRQAGEALKAQFPTQWPTIRDYGFAHPEIVGYMNAYAPEDAKIAYSLVPGLGIRWIENGSGSATDLAFIDTGFNLTSDLIFAVEGKIGAMGVHTGSQSISSPALYISLALGAGSHMAYITSWVAGLKCETDYSVAELTSTRLVKKDANGNELLSVNRGTNINRPLYLMASNGSSGKYTFQSSIKKGNFKNNSKEVNLIPFKLGVARTADKVSTGVAQAAGTKGMIDLLTGIFYPNANSSGSFTESISETPAS